MVACKPDSEYEYPKMPEHGRIRYNFFFVVLLFTRYPAPSFVPRHPVSLFSLAPLLPYHFMESSAMFGELHRCPLLVSSRFPPPVIARARVAQGNRGRGHHVRQVPVA
jgi:hypothetical protein